MGEKKRREATMSPQEKLASQLTHQALQDRKLIEIGFQSLAALVVPPQAPPEQISDLRKFFFSGALHLMQSIMHALDPDKEPTEADMRRMAAISEELKDFEQKLELELTPEKGRA